MKLSDSPDWYYCPEWFCKYDENGCGRNCNCDECDVYKEHKCSTCDLYPLCYPGE